MSKPPFFSVIIPVYNKEKHLSRSMNSVLNQTFRDYEVILVCDPSTDQSTEIAQSYVGENVTVLTRDAPGPGGYAARNLGLKKAQGKWVAFLDADDEWTPKHLERVHKCTLDYPDINIIGAGWRIVGQNSVKLDKYSQNFQSQDCHIVTLKHYLQQGVHGKRPIHTSVASVKRSALPKDPLFIIHPEVKRGGDLFAWLKLLCIHREMAWSNHIGANYYTNATNMVTKTAPSTGFLMSKHSIDSLNCSLSKEENKLFFRYLNRWLRNDWKSNIHRGCINFRLFNKLYWKEDFISAFIYYVTTVWPQNLRRLFGWSGKKR